MSTWSNACLVSRARCSVLHAASQSRDRTKLGVWYGPGSAVHRYNPPKTRVNALMEALHRVRDMEETAMNELDFSGKQILVIGGSSGIGTGIAQAFRAKGARVAVCGTRASAADYSADEGSHLEALDYAQLDVSNPQAIETFNPPFEKLDVLVLAQGA